MNSSTYLVLFCFLMHREVVDDELIIFINCPFWWNRTGDLGSGTRYANHAPTEQK